MRPKFYGIDVNIENNGSGEDCSSADAVKGNALAMAINAERAACPPRPALVP